jgi:hypothetical protein
MIIETKVTTRASTNDTFFTESPQTSARQALKDTMVPLVADGKYTFSYTLNETGLVQTSTATFADLATYSQYDTSISIELDYEYNVWATANALNESEIATQYTQSGIDQEFTCTTTYNYNSETTDSYPLFESFIDVIESSDNLINFTNTGNQLIAVHKYLNSADFTATHWKDYNFIESLHAAGITRTITYALI